LVDGILKDIGLSHSISGALSKLIRTLVANAADNMPTGHAAWLAVPDACLCAPIFVAAFNDRVPALVSSRNWSCDGTAQLTRVGEIETRIAAHDAPTHVAVGFLIGLVSLDFGLTTASSCFLIWLETVRDQPVPTLPM
jgi:hypothetical protein